VCEIDEVLKQWPGLGTRVGDAEALRAQLAKKHGSIILGLSTHLTASEIAGELYLSPHTIKSEVKSIYRKLDAASRDQAVTRARELGLLEGSGPSLPPSGR
jgi:LuxR family transcriptional regulator, maltose regulon positive regulatory protein